MENRCMWRMSFAHAYRCQWPIVDRATERFVNDAGPEKLERDRRHTQHKAVRMAKDEE